MESKFIEKLYLAFFIILPLVCCNNLLDFVLIPRQIFLGIFLLVLLIVLQFIKTEVFPYKNKLFIVYFVFILINLFSFKQASLVSESHAIFAKLILIFIFFITTSILLINKIITIKTIVFSVIIFSVIANITAIIQLVEKTNNGQHLTAQIGLITGNFSNKNLLSSVLFLCFPFLFLGLSETKIIKYISIGTLLSTFFILILVRTRVVLIACILSFILLLFFKIIEKYKIKLKYIVISIASFIFLFLYAFIYFLEKVNLKTNNSVGYLDQYLYRLLDSETFKTRVLIWKNSIEIFKEHWLFGVGLGNWQLIFPKNGLDNFQALDDILNGETTLQRPHNDFIWILCETGIVGFITYLLLFVILFYQLFYLIKNAKTNLEKRNWYYLFSGIVGYILISFFDFPYERIEHQILLITLFAIVSSQYYELKKFKVTFHKNNYIFMIFIFSIAYSLLVSYNRFNGERYTAKIYTARNNQNWDEVIIASTKAQNYFYKLDNASIPISWYEGTAHFNEKRIQESEDCFYAAYQLNPYNIYVINNLASAYQVNGKSDEAIKLYLSALKISKNFSEAKLNLAALYFNKKQYNNAILTIDNVNSETNNPKYKSYLIPILNYRINTFLKLNTNKNLGNYLVKEITTSTKLLQLYFNSKKRKMNFENYLKTLNLNN